MKKKSWIRRIILLLILAGLGIAGYLYRDQLMKIIFPKPLLNDHGYWDENGKWVDTSVCDPRTNKNCSVSNGSGKVYSSPVIPPEIVQSVTDHHR